MKTARNNKLSPCCRTESRNKEDEERLDKFCNPWFDSSIGRITREKRLSYAERVEAADGTCAEAPGIVSVVYNIASKPPSAIGAVQNAGGRDHGLKGKRDRDMSLELSCFQVVAFWPVVYGLVCKGPGEL